MDSEFLIKIIKILSKTLEHADVQQKDNKVRIVCECTYCGRSKRNFPHMGIILEPREKNTITGGAHCFRCGASKSLKAFLFDLKDILQFYGISIADIEKHVVVIEQEEKALSLDFQSINQKKLMEEYSFYNWIKTKYTDNVIRRHILLNMNAFIFIKNRLKLNFKNTVFEAFSLLRYLKANVYVNSDGKFVLMFDSKFRYIFEKTTPDIIKLEDERDIELFKSDKLPYVFKEYTKLKAPPKSSFDENDKYYIISDENCEDNYNILNVYITEGTFDALTMRYYKNLFKLDDINRIEENIKNMYVAVGHARIDKFVCEYLSGIIKNKSIIPSEIKEINFVMVPDLNMNAKRYVFSLYKFFQRCYKGIQSLNNMKISVYYLDLFNAVGDKIDEMKDVNELIGQFKKRTLRNIELVKVL